MRFYLRAMSYFKQDLLLIGSVLLLIGLSVCVGVLQAWPLGLMGDALAGQHPSDWIHRVFSAMQLPFTKHSTGLQLVGLALIGMLLKVAQDSISLSKNMVRFHLQYNGNSAARTELFQKLQSLGPEYHRNIPQGDAIYRVSNDVWGLFGILDGFIGAGASFVTLAAMTAVMLSRSLTVTAVAWSAAPMLMLVNWYFSRTLKRTSVEQKRVDTEMTTVLQRAVNSISLTQLFGRQFFEQAKFDQSVRRSVRALLKLNWQAEAYPLAVQSIFALWGAAVFGIGGCYAYNHPNTFHFSDVCAFMAYLGQLWEPLSRIIGFKAGIQGHVASAERVFHVLDQPVSVADAPDAVHLAVRSRTLTLHDVGFGYGPEVEPVLRSVSACVLPGQMVAFIGPSGTGKSTLLSLLPRLYDPTSGFISLDGYDLRKIKLADVRRHIALVPQDSTILAASISENIAYGRPGATRNQIREAAEMAGAAEFIRGLPEGFDTIVTEGGQNLSGGQRQRIAIARAVLSEAPILVLDEPTSALDPHHEHLVMEMLGRLRKHRTVVLVTHRIETVSDCDQIFLMNAGRIVERGNHAQLMAQGDQYSSLALRRTRSPASPSSAAPDTEETKTGGSEEEIYVAA
jgi:subfamily B ATP-binding cassette protein MsbA